MLEYYYDSIKSFQENIFTEGNEKKSIKSFLIVMIMHMLKLKYQNDFPAKKSWVDSIHSSYNSLYVQFKGIGKGSLFNNFYMRQLNLDEIYKIAVRQASIETHLPLSAFPSKCEWTKEQLIDSDFIYNFINELYNAD